ncbi:MAG: PhoH family protein [Rickettsiales bacterium]
MAQIESNDNSINLSFDDNALIASLYGEGDENLTKLEKKFGISTASRGNVLVLTGPQVAVESARTVIETLYGKLKKGQEMSSSQVDAALRMVGDMAEDSKADSKKEKMANISGNVVIKTMRKTVAPYSHSQAAYFKELYDKDLVFALGPAGTGKTYIAVAMAVHMFINKEVDRIILSRPAVEAGEKLGFLPGDLKEKIDPYLRPLYDALFDMLPAEKVTHYMETGEIEVAPLAFMRGRTLGNAYVILDEAQNTTPTQMKMFLTRMGENSRMVVTGDLSQCDLPRDVKSGLRDAAFKLEGIEGIGNIHFNEKDVVRHPLAARIVKAYDEWDKRKADKKKQADI